MSRPNMIKYKKLSLNFIYAIFDSTSAIWLEVVDVEK